MQIDELVGTQQYAEHWTSNPNFGVASAALLIVFMLVLCGFLFKYVTQTLVKKIDSDKNETVKCLNKLAEEVDDLKDRIIPIVTWINIQIKGQINGDGYDK